ncbi:MAG: PKD domain-containing protein [Acidimicrobiia bacterium]|nr:PKD domain-containing protein [Acidimicrobiia bacterium]
MLAQATVALCVAALGLAFLARPPAEAETPASIYVVEAPSSGINLDSVSFPAALAALDSAGDITLGLKIDNLPPLDLATNVTVESLTNDQVGTIAISGTATDVSLGRLGETDMDVVIYARWSDNDATSARPQVILGMRVADDVTLATVVGDSFGDIADIITFPELAFLTHTSSTSGDVKLSDLPPNAQGWFDEVYGTTLPAKVNYLGHVTIVSALELDQFGDEVKAILGYGDGAEVVLQGSLGITFDDFQDGIELTGDWALSALLPPTQLPQVARDLLQVDTAITWTFGISYVEADKKLTTTVSGKVTGTALGGEREFTMTGVVSTFEKDGKTTLKVEITAATDGWEGALGLDWLDLEEIKVVIAYTEVESKDKDGKPKTTRVLDAKLTAKATVWTKSVTVTLAGKLGEKPEASLSVALNDSVSLGEVVDGIGLTDAFALLPAEALQPLRSIAVNSLTLGVRVSQPDDEVIFEFTAVGSIQMTIGVEPNTLTMGASLLLVFDEDGRVTFGMRPDQTITMGDLLGLFGLDLGDIPDMTIVGDSSTGPFFGFVVTTKAIESTSSVKLSTAEADFYRPLFGNVEVFTVDIPQGVTALGVFGMPEPINGFLKNTIGVSPIVTAKGAFPLFGPGDLSLELALKPDPENLPYFIDANSKLFIKMEASIASPSLKLTLGGELKIRFKAGLPPELYNLLNPDPNNPVLPVQQAVPVDPDYECPNGTEPEVIVENTDGGITNDTFENYYCIDHLSAGVSASLSVSPTSAAVSTEVEFKSTPAGSVWYPFGQPWVGVSGLGAKLELSWSSTAAPPGFSISIGFKGDATVNIGDAGTDALVSLKLGITPMVNPPWVMVDFGGIRVASGQGIEFHELVALAEDTAQIIEPTATIPTDALPNLAIRNLEFSFSPEGDSFLCLPQGLVMTGDFYTDLTSGAPEANPDCSDTGESVIDPDDLCSANWDSGCFVSGLLSISTSGLEGVFEMAPFDLGPIHFGFDPGDGTGRQFNRVDVAATLTDQHFEIQGGVEIDNLLDPGQALAKGDLSLSLRPTEFDYYGRLEFLGFSVLADGHAALNLLTADSPELYLHILLATNQARVGESDFNVIVSKIAALPLNAIESAFLVIDGIITDLDTADGSVEVLRNLPNRLEEADLPVDQWMRDLTGGAADLLDALKKFGIDIDIDVLFNGFSVRVWPFPRVTIPGICPLLPDDVKDPSGRCSMAKIVDKALEPLFDDLLGIPGLSISNLRQGLRDLFEGEGPALTLTCVEFELELSDQATATELTVNAEIKGNPVGFSVGWDFKKSLVHNAGELVDGIMWAASGRPPPPCAGLNTALFATQPVRTEPMLETTLEPGVVDEGGSVTLSGTFGVPLPEARTVRIDWGDGSSQDVTVAKDAESFSRSHTYADDDPTKSRHDIVTVTAEDLSEGGERISHNLTVNNVAPVVDAVTLATGPIEEDQETQLTVAFHDVGVLDTHTVVIDWGDGAVSEVETAAGSSAVTVGHRYLDDNPTDTPQDDIVIGVTVVDDDLGRGFGTAVISVHNVQPEGVSLTRVEPGPVLEGEVATFIIEFEDPGTIDEHWVWIDWDEDGVIDSDTGVDEGARTVIVGYTYVDDDPTSTPVDSYDVDITLYDDDRGETLWVVPLDVHNVAPEITALDVADIDESEFAVLEVTFTDPGMVDTHEVVVDWGDSTVIDTALLAGERSVLFMHRYVDDDPTASPSDEYTITVTVTDDDTGTDTDTTVIEVFNVEPTIDAGPDQRVARQHQITLGPAVFRDQGTADTHTATVNWGDGTVDVGVVLEEPFGYPGSGAGMEGTVWAAHVYEAPAIYNVIVCVSDDDQATPPVCDSLRVTVTATAEWFPVGPPAGACEVLVWFDEVRIISDTEVGADSWWVTAAARFFDASSTRDREVSSTGLARFRGDTGDTVVLEQQWRTESWGSYLPGQIRFDDLSIVVSELDGRMGNDTRTFHASPEIPLACGETGSMTIQFPILPGSSRYMTSDDHHSVIEIDLTVTTVQIGRFAIPVRPIRYR